MSKTRIKRGGQRNQPGRIAKQEGKSAQDPGAVGHRAEKGYGSYPLSGMPEGFECAVGVRTGQDSGQSNGQSGDMGQGIEIGRAGAAAHPQPLLAGGLEAGIVSLALGTQGIGSLEIEAVAVNGKPVVQGGGSVFGTAPVLPAIVPVFVVTGTSAVLGLPEGTAEFLAGAPVVCCFSILVHGEASVTDWVAHRK